MLLAEAQASPRAWCARLRERRRAWCASPAAAPPPPHDHHHHHHPSFLTRFSAAINPLSRTVAHTRLMPWSGFSRLAILMASTNASASAQRPRIG
jgi:hypothetical protein